MTIHPLCLPSTLLLAIAIASGPASASTRTKSPLAVTPRIHRLVVKDEPARDRKPATQTAATRHSKPAGDRSRQSLRMVDRRQLAHLMAREDRERQHEQAQVDARATHIYALSQTNAPILADTSACKRIGAHGESIYENCALAAATPRVR